VLESLAVGHTEGLVGRHGDVGFDAGTLPVGTGNRVDGSRVRDHDLQGRAEGEDLDWMRPTAGGLPNESGALQCLEVVAELFASGESLFADQHVDRRALRPYQVR